MVYRPVLFKTGEGRTLLSLGDAAPLDEVLQQVLSDSDVSGSFTARKGTSRQRLQPSEGNQNFVQADDAPADASHHELEDREAHEVDEEEEGDQCHRPTESVVGGVSMRCVHESYSIT